MVQPLYKSVCNYLGKLSSRLAPGWEAQGAGIGEEDIGNESHGDVLILVLGGD